MNKFAIIGSPGAGRSTQASMLARALDLVRISVGDMLRWNIRNRTKLGARLQTFVEDGILAPDDLVNSVVRDRLERHDWNYGFVLDGYPATRAQAEFLLESYGVDGVIWLQVPDDIACERLSNQAICESCGVDHNLLSRPRKFETTCEICGGKLVNRHRPNLEESQAPLVDFHEKLEPALEVFRQKQLLVTIQGNKGRDEIHQEIQVAFGLASEAMRQILATVENRPVNS